MNYLDWIVIVIYLLGVILLALYFNRRQNNTEDYYLGGRKIKWWQSGASTMATQLGAISFVSAPAFVALKENGGLKWLSYEFGVPLALILVMAIIIPVLHQKHYISIYQFLEDRFDAGTRSLVSFLFQVGRGLATAMAVLAGGLVLSTALNISTETAIILIGSVTVFYDVLGGIRVVILSDVLQMVIIITGILICGYVAFSIVGIETTLSTISADRLQVFDFSHFGFREGETYAFWPMLIGGIFLYASYYGTDQSQVQRELSVGHVDEVRKSLIVNAVGRFPLVLSYCLMGLFVGAVFARPETLSQVGSTLGVSANQVGQILQQEPERMVPMFIVSFLPNGLIGFIFIAIMAALMSSLDSGLNSLSAVTMKDFYQRYIRPNASEKHYFKISKLITLFWGIFCVSAALLFYEISEAASQTTIVWINAIGSTLYGPILAAFLTGMFVKKMRAGSIKIGIISGILVNLFVLFFTPVSWLWWNVIGFVVTIGVAFLMEKFVLSRMTRLAFVLPQIVTERHSSGYWGRLYWVITAYFFLIITVSLIIEHLS
jgi:solute carrier family 5 (sodium-dependent multivitamin transporter), member 6